MLLIFQAMDAAGKDGAIKHVMSGVNPQGCQVTSFKAPSAEDLDHDYLWRCTKHLPERGRIGIFNRSYYEEVLVVRVHPEFLAKQKLPQELVGKDIWDERFRDIRGLRALPDAQRHRSSASSSSTSRAKEQKRRFLERLDDPEKNWKFSATDAQRARATGRTTWSAYEDTIRKTATHEAPWYVVPADNKWYTRVVVAAAVVDALASLDLEYPEVGKRELAELAQGQGGAARREMRLRPRRIPGGWPCWSGPGPAARAGAAACPRRARRARRGEDARCRKSSRTR